MPSQEVAKNARKVQMYTREATLTSSFPSTNLSKVGLDPAIGGYSQTAASITGAAAPAAVDFRVGMKQKASVIPGTMNVSHSFNTVNSNVEGGASMYQTSFKISKKNAPPDVVAATQVDVLPQEVPTQIQGWLIEGNSSKVAASNPVYSFGVVTGTTVDCLASTQVWSCLDRKTGDFKSVYVKPQ